MASIWYISKYATAPQYSNVGSRGFNFIREFFRAGHTGMVITSGSNHLLRNKSVEGAAEVELVENVPFVWLKGIRYRSPYSLMRVISWFEFECRLIVYLLKRKGPSPDFVIISSLSLLTVLTGFWIRRRYGAKIIFEVRDIWPLMLEVAGGYSHRNPILWVLRRVEAAGYRHYDQIVGTMPNLTAHVRAIGGPTAPVHFIPQGITPFLLEEPTPLPSHYLETYLPNTDFVVCHAGSLGSDNAVDTLLSAAELLLPHSNISFLIVGQGYLKGELQEAAKTLSNVTFCPEVSKSSLQKLLVKCDLLYLATHNSKMMEFGQSLNKLVDYMVAAKPVLASYSGFRSMINEADCGWFVEAENPNRLAEEIIRISLLDGEVREAAGQRGRKWIMEHRRFETLAQRYLDIMQHA